MRIYRIPVFSAYKNFHFAVDMLSPTTSVELTELFSIRRIQLILLCLLHDVRQVLFYRSL